MRCRAPGVTCLRSCYQDAEGLRAADCPRPSTLVLGSLDLELGSCDVLRLSVPEKLRRLGLRLVTKRMLGAHVLTPVSF